MPTAAPAFLPPAYGFGKVRVSSAQETNVASFLITFVIGVICRSSSSRLGAAVAETADRQTTRRTDRAAARI